MSSKISLSSGFNSDSDVENDYCSEISTGLEQSSTLLTVVEVHSVTVRKKAIGIVNGNINNRTLNEILLPERTDNSYESDPEIIQNFLQDAIPVHSLTKSTFRSNDSYSFTWCGVTVDFQNFDRKRFVLTWIIVLISVIFVVFASVWFSKSSSSSSSSITSKEKEKLTNDVCTSTDAPNQTVEIVNRTSWGALNLHGFDMSRNLLPVKQVIVGHTARNTCMSHEECIAEMQAIQQFHMNALYYVDIGYNFLVGGDGRVYEGRGWDNVGQHTKWHNYGTLGVGFAGTFINSLPNEAMVKTFADLMELGVQLCKISQRYTLVGQCQLKDTKSPGKALIVDMINWPHFCIKCTEKKINFKVN